MTLYDWVHFTRPYWLLIMPIIWLLYFLLSWQVRSIALKQTIAPHLLPFLSATAPSHPARKWAGLISISLFAIALSGISFTKEESPLYTPTSKTVFIVDQSISLYATDIRPNRLTKAKQILRDIINSSKIEGELALIAFAGDAYTISPFTQDKQTLVHFLVALDPLIMPLYGSNLASGIEDALALITPSDYPYTTFVLITDDLSDADIDYLNSHVANTNIKLDMISVGSSEGAPIKLPNGQILRQQGKIIKPSVPIEKMRSSMRAINAGYFPYHNQSKNTDYLAIQSRQTDTAKNSNIKGIVWQEQGHWLALPFCLWLLWQFRGGLVFVFLLCIFNQSSPVQASPLDWFKTNDQKAQQAVDAGDWKSAEKLFENQRWQAATHYANEDYASAVEKLENIANSASDYYNLGNAKALNNDLDGAIEAYQKALEQQPDFSEAKENLKYAKGKKKQQQEDSNNPSSSKDSNSNNNESDNSQSKQDQNSSQNSNTDANKNESKQDNPNGNQDNQAKPSESQEQPLANKQASAQEEQQALQQWLRQIQDDPGTLLQNKLLYLHQQRRNENRFSQKEGMKPW